MFTGLVADIGRIARLERAGPNWEMTVQTALDLESVDIGESIAVDGTCLTVVELGKDCFGVEASPETLRRTTLGDYSVGRSVHLERAVRVGGRMGGHFVLGHVDGVGELVGRRRQKNAWILDIRAPDDVADFLIDKGSITVDGVSLTVNAVDADRFEVAIIPHTADQTNLADYRVGRPINLEADVVGKYVHKFVAPSDSKPAIRPELLEDMGF